MAARLSEYVKRARQRFPRSHRDRSIHGDGRFAVLTCAFSHPSAGSMCYSDVHLFSNLPDAEAFQRGLDECGRTGIPATKVGEHLAYCHAATKDLCKGKHELIDLGKVTTTVPKSAKTLFD